MLDCLDYTIVTVAVSLLLTYILFKAMLKSDKKNNPMIYRNKMHYEVNKIDIQVDMTKKNDAKAIVTFVDQENSQVIFEKKVDKDTILNDPYCITFMFLNWLEEDYKK